LEKKHSIWDISRGWFERQRVTAVYNQRDRSCNKYQPGGTAMICRGQTALRVIETGQDPKRLGRWAWTLFKGKQDKLTRVISVYVPCIARKFGCRKVYCQQQRALLKMGMKGSVITVFWDDLWTQIDQWRDEGNQIIMAGDWNTDVQDNTFLQPFRERNLVPSITHRHGNQGPETYSRGSKPIDEIFCSSSLHVVSAGYMEHGKSTGDHQPIWVDISTESALGTNIPNLPSFNAHRLKCQDPRIVTRYNRILEQYFITHGVYDRVYQLFNSFSTPLTIPEQQEYKKLDALREKGMIIAEKKCRKLRMGGLRWSPILQKARMAIHYLKLCLSKERKKKISSKYLQRLSNRLDIDANNSSQSQLREMIKTAFDRYKDIKSKHREHCRSFLEDLASALAAEGKGPKAAIIRNLLTIEDQKSMLKKRQNNKEE
jgi:hypothetical protein